MVFTGMQTTYLFNDNDHMVIPHSAIIQLQHDGIYNVNDLTGFDKDTLQQVSNNLNHPGGYIVDLNFVSEAVATIPTPYCMFGLNSHIHLMAESSLFSYYKIVGRELKDGKIRWDLVVNNSTQNCKALVNLKVIYYNKVTKIKRNHTVIKWTE